MPERVADAVVVGGGPNGLVAACRLADAGWDVVLCEAADHLGGAVVSQEPVPGYTVDLASAFYPLAAASPALRRLDLGHHGLTWAHAPAVVAHPAGPDDERAAVLHRDPAVTAARLDAEAPGDGETWLELLAQWRRMRDPLLDVLLGPFPPVPATLRLLRRMGKAPDAIRLARTLLLPLSQLGEELFKGQNGRLLLAGNAMHADIPMTAPGSGLFGMLLAMLGHSVGFPVPEGGAGRLASALADRFISRGGTIELGSRAERILTDHRRVSGVRTSTGEHHHVRAVVADVSAPALYGQLVPFDELPARVATRMARFEIDPATIKVDWALSAPVPWASPPPAAPGTVHIADSMDELRMSLEKVHAHVVPAKPFLLVGQMSTADPTRSPPGTEALWAYTHLPQVVHTDESDEVTGTWDDSEVERLADRMQDRLERYAPGFGSTVTARRVLGPHQLQARNENLINGAVNGGTAGLHQQLMLRPIPGSGRAETPIRGLFLASSAAHPGGGVHGAAGANAARALGAAARTGRL
jgi:phytoene dehydrogenase-like protein